MKKKEFIHLEIGDVIYNEHTEQVRELVSQFANPEEIDESGILYTRNSLLKGFEGYDKDKLDIPVKEHMHWMKYDNYLAVKSVKIREKMMLYEVTKLKILRYREDIPLVEGMFSEFL